MRILNKIIIFAAAVLLFATIFKFNDKDGLFKDFNYTLNIYVENDNGYDSIEAGNFKIVTCSKQEENDVLKNLDNVIGKSYKLDAEFDIEKFIKQNNFQIQFSQELEDETIYYLYNFKINDFAIVNGKKISMQIVKTDDYVIAAEPLILGGY